MTRAMNEVLERHFGQVSASLARQKSRVLLAGEPRRSAVPGIETRDEQTGIETDTGPVAETVAGAEHN